MIEISTARTVIRNFLPGDWFDLQEIAADKEASPYALYDHPFPTTEQEIQQITGWFSKHDNYLAVSDTAAKKVIGYIALNGEGTEEFGLGYCVHSSYQNKGYATEACMAVINHAFGTLGAKRLTSGTAVLNLPSCRLLSRLGFRKTGENTVSFRKNEEGKAIEFTGATFELPRDAWERMDYIGLP